MTERCALTRGATRGATRVVRMPPLKKCRTAVTIKMMKSETRVQVTTKEAKGKSKI